MTVHDFLTEAQAYYGRYNEAQKRAVIAWLSQKKDKELDFVYAEVLKALSAVYKTPPGIKELEDAFRIVKKERWREVYPALPELLPEKASPEIREGLAEMLNSLIKSKRFKGV